MKQTEFKTARVVVRLTPSKMKKFEEYVKSLDSTKTKVVESYIDECILKLEEK